ncbi:MAG TPA: beta-N-acetylhexosaminidase [Ktedonobacteraceae bacterium]|nr:beta-N-acetylhexosaminidase [Ktedonobacteraceae bacterium]
MSEHLTAGMSLDEQIGQLLMVGLPGTTLNAEIIELIQHYHVGNIILFKRNIQDVEQVRELTQSLQQIAREAGQRFPMLISVDQENGMIRRFGEQATIFPGNMALGAIGSEQLTYEIAEATGRELQAMGINMNLSPVVDVNNNPANPVIGVRSFGENPAEVARLASALVRGYHAAGVITNLKHFPGHGDTATDSHLALPVIPFGLERLEQLELIPFKQAIAAGADSVMIAHLFLPQLMKELDLPSTVSPEIVRDLLRTKLDFQGMILTDCLEMNAVSETIGTAQGALLALKAGNDLLLVSHRYDRQRDSVELLRRSVEDGSLTPDLISDAAERILRLKQQYLSWEKLANAPGPEVVQSPAHLQLRDRAYELSTTLIRNEQHLIPLHLQPEQRLLTLFLEPTSYTKAIDDHSVNTDILHTLQQHHANTRVLVVHTSAEPEENAILQEALDSADVVLAVTLNANRDQQQASLVQSLLASGKSVIGLAAFNPYDLLAFPELKTYLVSYEDTLPALLAATRVIFGDIPAQGKLPVTLPVS